MTLVLPMHSRFKVSNMEQSQWNNITKCILRDWKNVLIVMEVNKGHKVFTAGHDETRLITRYSCEAH